MFERPQKSVINVSLKEEKIELSLIRQVGFS